MNIKQSILYVIIFYIAFSHPLPTTSRRLTQQTQNAPILQLSSSPTSSICPDNCAYCNSSSTPICQQCIIGYTIRVDGTCNKCLEGCSICRGQQVCSQCNTGYTKISDGYLVRCVSCSSNCLQCIFFQADTGSLELTTCSKCAPGFYITTQSTSIISVCAPCTQYCFNCANSSHCNQCATGFGYNAKLNQCEPCQSNCISCLPDIGCQQCKIGYYLSVGDINTCQQCIKDCLLCGSSGTCQKCSKGYYPYNLTNPQTGLYTSVCVSCPNQCVLCHSENICSQCQSGYFLSIIYQQQYNNSTNQTTLIVKSATCNVCNSNCLACQLEQICSTCLTGYFVNSQGICQICETACHQCLNTGQCLQCLGSYYLKSGKCQPCNPLCSTCQVHLVPESQQQIPYCTDCVSFYYTLIDGQCVSCGSLLIGCSTCSNPNNCLTCIEGYSLHEQNCLENKKLGVVYIVMLSIAGIIALVAIIFGLWACWRSRNNNNLAGYSSSSPGIRGSYYQIP